MNSSKYCFCPSPQLFRHVYIARVPQSIGSSDDDDAGFADAEAEAGVVLESLPVAAAVAAAAAEAAATDAALPSLSTPK